MSSLFGSLNNSQQSKPSLFSTPSTSAPSGGMFSSLNTPKTTAPSGGLFGSSTTGSALGGLGLGSSAQPQGQSGTAAGSGLFGSAGLGQSQTQQQQQQPQQQQGGGFFGGAAQQQQAPQNSQQSGSDLFKSLPAGSQSQQPSSSLQGSLAQQPQNGNAYFDSILERSRKRAHIEASAEDLPQLQLGLGDLRQRIKKLGSGNQDRSVDGKAHYLLAASGVDPGATVRDLNFFNSTTGRVERAQSQEANDTDVEGYLANLQTQTTLSMISDGLERSIRDFDAFLEDNVTMEWDNQRKKIYSHFGIKPTESAIRDRSKLGSALSGSSPASFGRSRRGKGAAMAASRASATESTFGRSGMQKSVIGAAGPIGSTNQPLFSDVEKNMEANGIVAGSHDRFQREKQNRYADKVQALNLARLQKRTYPICDEFASVVKLSGENSAVEMVKAYKSVINIVGENLEITSLSDPQAVKSRQFAEAYLDESPSSAKNTQLKKQIIRGGAKCFEKLKFNEMEELIAKNPREANLGGIPNVISKVKAFVRLQAGTKHLASDNTDLQMLGDDYVWALVYYLLRTGHVQEAVEYVASNAVAFRAIDRNFASYITDYANSPDRRLRRDLQDRINSEYNQRLRIAPENSIDPYRMVCYKIIGRCDLGSPMLESIKQDFEDLVWSQLMFARETNRVDEIANESFRLENAQSMVRGVVSRSKINEGIGSSWGCFVFFLIAVGLFEEAVDFLYMHSYTDAVHLAIALDYYGLLRVSDPAAWSGDFKSLTTRNNPQISFGMMLGFYTRDFRAANPAAAVDYLTLICLNQDLPDQAGSSQVELCHNALRELVLESREFALLLGDMRADGQRIKGLIEERIKLISLNETSDFMRTITIQAASVADDNGRITDAVLLYHLAGEYDNVIVIIARALSEAISVPIGQDHAKLQPLKPRALPEGPHVQGSSLSLTSVDDPVTLARDITRIYTNNQMYRSKIKQANGTACGILLQMSEAKTRVAHQQYYEALEVISGLQLLPLKALGNPSEIRAYANKFHELSQPVASCISSLLMWTLTCCNAIKTQMANSQYSANEGTRQSMLEEMRQNIMDITTYTSQLRFRLPELLQEALARSQSD